MAAALRQTMMRALLRGGKAPAAPPPHPSSFGNKGTDLQRRHDELRTEARRNWQEEWNRAATRFGYLKSAIVVTILSGIGFAYRPRHAE